MAAPLTPYLLLRGLAECSNPNLGWICRNSTSGRGLRLHQTGEPVGEVHPLCGRKVQKTIREAIEDYLKDNHK